MNLPEAFLARMKKQLGAEYDAFVASYDADTSYGLRLNLLKGTVDEIIPVLPFALTNVPWIPEGFHVSSTERPGKHILHEAGAYYIQDPSAMSVITLLDPMPGERILDLCAAPGGKSTGMAARMQGQGLLVSNEIIPGRGKILSQNVERMGSTSALVCNESPERIASHFPLFFDKVLIDAPCSGEGMFRKDPAVIKTWEEERPEYFAKLQKDILKNGVRMLRPGGKLLYSTCTFAPVENEGSISWILEQCPEMELIPIEGYEGFSEGNPAWGDGREELRRCVRIWPHKMKGEGHFLALLKKSEDAPETRIRLEPPTRMDKKNKAVLEEFFKDCQWKPDWERVQIKGEKVYLVPELPAKLNGIHFLRNGLYLGDLKKNRFEPSQQLAMTLKASDYAGSVSLSPEDERIGRYLRGETLLLEPGEATREKGWILVCVDQYALGWGKLVNGVLKNKYWSGWRLKS